MASVSKELYPSASTVKPNWAEAVEPSSHVVVTLLDVLQRESQSSSLEGGEASKVAGRYLHALRQIVIASDSFRILVGCDLRVWTSIANFLASYPSSRTVKAKESEGLSNSFVLEDVLFLARSLISGHAQQELACCIGLLQYLWPEGTVLGDSEQAEELKWQFLNNICLFNEKRMGEVWLYLLSNRSTKIPLPGRKWMLPLTMILNRAISPSKGSETIQNLRLRALLESKHGMYLVTSLLEAADDIQPAQEVETLLNSILSAIHSLHCLKSFYNLCDQLEQRPSCSQIFILCQLVPTFSSDISHAIEGSSLKEITTSAIELLISATIPHFYSVLTFQRDVIAGSAASNSFLISAMELKRLHKLLNNHITLIDSLVEQSSIDLEVRNTVVTVFVQALGTLEVTIPKFDLKGSIAGTGTLSSSAPSTPAESWGQGAYYLWPDLKSSLISSIAGLVHQNRNAQDAVRSAGGVQLVLNCLRFDKNNTMLKEYAVLAVKFLLEGNTENQKIVERLRTGDN